MTDVWHNLLTATAKMYFKNTNKAHSFQKFFFFEKKSYSHFLHRNIQNVFSSNKLIAKRVVIPPLQYVVIFQMHKFEFHSDEKLYSNYWIKTLKTYSKERIG